MIVNLFLISNPKALCISTHTQSDAGWEMGAGRAPSPLGRRPAAPRHSDQQHAPHSTGEEREEKRGEKEGKKTEGGGGDKGEGAQKKKKKSVVFEGGGGGSVVYHPASAG